MAQYSSSPDEPGWYLDPEGTHPHEAYWDGERWTGATRSPGLSGTLFATRPDLRMVAQVLLAIVGFSVGSYLTLIGLTSVIGIFEPTDFGRILSFPTLAGLTLFVWTLMGVTRPTPWRYIPPALGSIAVIVWFLFFF